MQGSGETFSTGCIPADSSPTGLAEGLPHYLLHQSSSTSAGSGMTEQLAGLRHINIRKRATSFTAASPRQSLYQCNMTVSSNSMLYHKQIS